MAILVEVSSEIDFKFQFKKYTEHILAVIPKQDLAGISIIRYCTWDKPDKGNDWIGLARYWPTVDSKNCVIEVNIGQLIAIGKIPKYVFEVLGEIAALLLSEYVCHEVGHHVSYVRKRRMKYAKSEAFANKYAVAGYDAYLRSRKKKILFLYWLASIWIVGFESHVREAFSVGRNEIKEWIATRPPLNFP